MLRRWDQSLFKEKKGGKKVGLNKKVTFRKPNVKDNVVGSSKSHVLSPTCSPSKKWIKKVILNDKKPNCPFRLYASWMTKENSFQIKSLNSDHKCSRNYNLGALVNYRWIVAQCAREIIKDPFIPLRTMKEDIRQKYMIDVSLGQCKRAKQTVLYDYEGGLIDHYRKLYEYRQALIELNPGTTCRLDVEETSAGNTYFNRMYVCFKGVKYGWLAGCRKVIGLDGCFLKHTYRGELLTAIGRDANNQMHPIAWAIVRVENAENWSWFLSLLHDDLNMNNGTRIIIISDSHKGLLDPGAATSTLQQQFDQYMAQIRLLNESAYEYLVGRNPNSWSRAFFEMDKRCVAFENGICESFNRAIVIPRSKPIITMLEEIRVYVMQRLVAMNKLALNLEDTITPSIRKLLEKLKVDQRTQQNWVQKCYSTTTKKVVREAGRKTQRVRPQCASRGGGIGRRGGGRGSGRGKKDGSGPSNQTPSGGYSGGPLTDEHVNEQELREHLKEEARVEQEYLYAYRAEQEYEVRMDWMHPSHWQSDEESSLVESNNKSSPFDNPTQPTQQSVVEHVQKNEKAPMNEDVQSDEITPPPSKKKNDKAPPLPFRIYVKNMGRSERIANQKKLFKFDDKGFGSTLDLAFDEMDDQYMTMEEYVHYKTKKALRNGKVYNWETAKYGKIDYIGDIDYLRFFDTKFLSIVYDDALSSEHWNNETSLSEYCDENVISERKDFLKKKFSILSIDIDLFSNDIFSVNDLKSDKDNSEDKIGIK
ncbi:calcium/proton exchanger [Tanacetum coccineum]